MSRSRPTTPIRRVSRGSISSHHRASFSGANAVSTPLTFLTQAMSDLSYETSTLHSNLECIEEIDRALLTFDESFSMFLYGLRMNAFCVEWPEAPGEENFDRFYERRKRQQANEHEVDFSSGRKSFNNVGEDVTITDFNLPPADQTYMTVDDDDAEVAHVKTNKAKTPLKSALKKSSVDTTSKAGSAATSSAPVKGRITLAEKKKREAKASEIIESLPLEYRGGGDVKSGQLAKSVILALLAAGNAGLKIADIVKMPELPQAKINKCMIALVAAKHVIKRSDNGVVYQLDPSRHPSL